MCFIINYEILIDIRKILVLIQQYIKKCII